MRRLVLILICLRFSAPAALGRQQEAAQEQKPTVESVDISGVPESRIGNDLRELMQQLVGRPFDQLAADEVGFKIQNEVSERIFAIRQFPGSKPGQIKLVFQFGNSTGEPEPESNVNSRYTVEAVEIDGAPDSILTDQLRRDMQNMVGRKLDEDRANDIEHRMARELRPLRDVSRRIERGADRDHIRIIYEVRKAPLFQFQKFGTYFVGQSKQGLSFGIEAPIEKKTNRLAFAVIDDGDVLIERDEGYRVGFENIKSVTEHLGVRLEYFDYRLKWKSATQLALAANPDVPGIYRERRGVEPSLTFAPDRRFRINVGASVTELQIQYPVIHFLNANAGFATVTLDNTWERANSERHRLIADYSVRTATHNLASDFVYTKHVGEARYTFSTRRSELVVSGSGGTLIGHAPLFERFSLGNTSTLRGWNKYDIAPLGGDRMWYGSAEYRYTVLQVYYDAGSVSGPAATGQTSHAVGFGLHSRNKDDDTWFFTLGIPIRSGHVQHLEPLFMFGVRF